MILFFIWKRESKKEQLDRYLLAKTRELKEDTTLPEFNLSRFKAKPSEGGNI